MFSIIFIAEIVFLFISSRYIVGKLTAFLLGLTKSKKVTVWILSVLFIPGTIVHEMAHYLSAIMLFVRVGRINLSPKIEGEHVALGSVEIGKADMGRRFLIGASPFVLGITIIAGVPFFILKNIPPDNISKILIAVAVSYFLFTVSNTMFSSKADMEGTIEILITLLTVFIAVYILGFRPEPSIIEKINTSQIIDLVQKSTLFLLAPIIIDLSILGIIRVFNRR